MHRLQLERRLPITITGFQTQDHLQNSCGAMVMEEEGPRVLSGKRACRRQLRGLGGLS